MDPWVVAAEKLVTQVVDPQTVVLVDDTMVDLVEDPSAVAQKLVALVEDLYTVLMAHPWSVAAEKRVAQVFDPQIVVLVEDLLAAVETFVGLVEDP